MKEAVSIGGEIQTLGVRGGVRKFAVQDTLAHLSRIEPAVGNEVAHPFVGPLHLPGCFQIDRPRVPEFSGSVSVTETLPGQPSSGERRLREEAHGLNVSDVEPGQE